MKKASSWIVLWASCCSCALPTGCSKASDKAPEKTKELNFYSQAEITSLDPRIGFDRRALQINRELFEGLMKIGKDGKPELALAKSFSLSEDKSTYTFHLKPAKWSNGLDVTADDIAWTWKSLLDHSTSSAGAYVLFIIKNAKKILQNQCPIEDFGVKVIDPLTLEVTLEHPAPYFLEYLSFPIYAPVCSTIAKADPQWASKVYPEYVSNGPYILKDRKIKSHILLEKNPMYRDQDSAATERMIFSIVEDPQTAYNMFEAGTLDWYGDTFGSMSLETVYELNRKGRLITTSSGGTHWLLCQTQTPHLNSPKIRKAIACAINRDAICDTLLQGGESPAYTMVHNSTSLSQEPSFEYNPEAAAQLFEEGMKELGYTKDTYPPITITHFSDPVVRAVAETEQQQLQQALGIKIDLLAVDWGTFIKSLTAGNYQLIWHLWYTWLQDPIYNLEFVKYKGKGQNSTGWESPEYIRLLDLADASIDSHERVSYLRQAEAVLMQDFPAIPVFFHTFKYSKKPELSGESLSAVGQLELKRIEKVG